MKYFTLLSALVLLSSISSCNKGNLPEPESITGKWRWVKSVGGIGGLTITPQTAGYSLTQQFNADSTVKIFKNDTLTTETRFSITKHYQYNASEKINLLKIDDHKMAFSIKNDTLFTTDVFISDGYGSAYVRLK